MSKYLIAQTDGSLLDSSTNGASNTSITGTLAATGNANLEGTTNQIGDDAKTAYNKLTGHTKIDDRPIGGTTDDYALQIRSESAKTTGMHWGVDCETHLKADGAASLRSVQGVAVVDAGFTATAATLIGAYGQARVDGDMAGASFLAALYGLIENSTALTASHVAALWLDTHQANAITGSYQLMYMTENGAEPLDQVMYMRTPGAKALMELDTCSAFVSDTAETAGSAKKIKITIDGTAYYINVYPGA